MLMTGVQQAQRTLRLIATRLSAAGQSLLPHTVINQHWQTGRENMLGCDGGLVSWGQILLLLPTSSQKKRAYRAGQTADKHV